MRSFDSLTREDVRNLCDSLLEETQDVIEVCITFFEADTKGLWHNRGRAKLARRFKHINMTQNQKERLLVKVIERFQNGDFSEQFVDQLRLALQIDSGRMFVTAEKIDACTHSHISRYASWILSHRNETAEQSAASKSKCEKHK